MSESRELFKMSYSQLYDFHAFVLFLDKADSLTFLCFSNRCYNFQIIFKIFKLALPLMG